MADQVPQPAPACGLRAIHRRADAGRAEPEQRLAGVAVVARYEGDGRDGGKLAYEPGDRGELVAAAGVDREDERVHPLPPGRPQRVPERAGVDRRKTTVARRIEAGTLGRRQDSADGHHAGETLAWTHQPRLKCRRHRARTPRAGPPPPQPPVNARPSRNGCGVTSPRSRASATRAPRPSDIGPPATTSQASCPRSASAWTSHRSRFGDARTTTSWAGCPGATRGGRRSSSGRTSTRPLTRPARTTTPAASPRCSNAPAPWPPGNRRPASSSWGSTWRNCRR